MQALLTDPLQKKEFIKQALKAAVDTIKIKPIVPDMITKNYEVLYLDIRKTHSKDLSVYLIPFNNYTDLDCEHKLCLLENGLKHLINDFDLYTKKVEYVEREGASLWYATHNIPLPTKYLPIASWS